MIENLSKYIVKFGHVEKLLLILSATSGSISVVSFPTVISELVRITSPSLCLVSFNNGIPK